MVHFEIPIIVEGEDCDYQDTTLVTITPEYVLFDTKKEFRMTHDTFRKLVAVQNALEKG